MWCVPISLQCLAIPYMKVRHVCNRTFPRCFAHLCFGLGRGPITTPRPAMALTDRKHLNLTKQKLLPPAPVCMCVCVSPDCPGVTSEGLQHLGKLRSLKHLQLQRMNAMVINGQGGNDPWGWIKKPCDFLSSLYISGELQRHTHCRYQHCMNRANGRRHMAGIHVNTCLTT